MDEGRVQFRDEILINLNVGNVKYAAEKTVLAKITLFFFLFLFLPLFVWPIIS